MIPRVPERTPVLVFKLTPVGNVPLETAQVYGVYPPVAISG